MKSYACCLILPPPPMIHFSRLRWWLGALPALCRLFENWAVYLRCVFLAGCMSILHGAGFQNISPTGVDGRFQWTNSNYFQRMLFCFEEVGTPKEEFCRSEGGLLGGPVEHSFYDADGGQALHKESTSGEIAVIDATHIYQSTKSSRGHPDCLLFSEVNRNLKKETREGSCSLEKGTGQPIIFGHRKWAQQTFPGSKGFKSDLCSEGLECHNRGKKHSIPQFLQDCIHQNQQTSHTCFSFNFSASVPQYLHDNSSLFFVRFCATQLGKNQMKQTRLMESFPFFFIFTQPKKKKEKIFLQDLTDVLYTRGRCQLILQHEMYAEHTTFNRLISPLIKSSTFLGQNLCEYARTLLTSLCFFFPPPPSCMHKDDQPVTVAKEKKMADVDLFFPWRRRIVFPMKLGHLIVFVLKSYGFMGIEWSALCTQHQPNQPCNSNQSNQQTMVSNPMHPLPKSEQYTCHLMDNHNKKYLGYSISHQSSKRCMDLFKQTKCVVHNPETYSTQGPIATLTSKEINQVN
ncbi:hypothetical protein VP01_656g2 [Puccinia sorghi]|uniref:Uncharacterized protein n=1 Tax=Puccinia sorghi TaxID=27349 RepID=A0A0L6UFC0_9BASI|nr:hypothetical protein VP01_656g2 [Puccinia sorghi]